MAKRRKKQTPIRLTPDEVKSLLFVPEHGPATRQPSEAERTWHQGVAAVKQMQLELGCERFSKAIALDPRCVDAHMNLACTLSVLGRLDDAIAAAERAVTFEHPKMHFVCALLGSMLTLVGRVDQSTRWFRRALAQSANPAYHSSFVMSLNYHDGYSATAILEEARRWNDAYAAPLAAKIQPHANNRDPDRRLRVGYVSPHFRAWSIAQFVLPTFHHHNRDDFEVFAYTNANPQQEDETTEELRRCVDHWRSIVALSDDAAAKVIRDDRIDVLVDLCGHMTDNRILVFARRPAPLQVFWLAYPGTTGLSAMTHRVTDAYLDPAGTDVSVYSEKTICLPDSFWLYQPLREGVLPVSPLPALSNGYVTFGSLNAFLKVGEAAIAAWSEVLRSVEGSRMLLLTPKGEPRRRTLAAFERKGVEGSRIEFVDQQPFGQYIATYQRIDIQLDTFPVNGHTTALDSYWMGVPVVTMVGPNVNGRAGLCISNNLGLPELVAHTPDEYVRIATALAAPEHRDRLAELRAGLRARMQASPLMDAPRFVRNLESAYRTIWRQWCEERALESGAGPSASTHEAAHP